MDEDKMVLCKKNYGRYFKKGNLYQILDVTIIYYLSSMSNITGVSDEIVIILNPSITENEIKFSMNHSEKYPNFHEYFHTTEQTKRILKIKKIKDNYGKRK